ncbi:hypothetical protein FHS29_000808 [Saccharothrix tamanrassetensis]|uniref:Secreted protein n=1 Tax=Saccharothrix tamanrassetensis TaxID=1051531 RepID=A0A841CDJ0_9PSEU|nr:hypothetical protein [Saccharothrix tamanrassetensis]MBB5954238.1 hypothetical protein [Saccharothrix tamanrassetensis]
MSAHRTRGILRAAALLAAGATPLLVGSASAAQQPLDVVEGSLSDAPKTSLELTKSATDLLGDQAVRLPLPVRDQVAVEAQLPAVADLPASPEVPSVPKARDLPQDAKLPVVAQLPGVSEVQPPNLQQPGLPGLPDAPKPPIDLPPLG